MARKHQLMIFSDEIYDRLVFDGEEHVSIASMAPRPVLRHLQRSLKEPHDRWLSYWLDGSFRQPRLRS